MELNLLNPNDRERVFKKILKKDVEISKKFASCCGEFLNIWKYKNYLSFLEYSCNGIVWLAALIALSYLIVNDGMIELEVNLLFALILDIIIVAVVKAFTQRKRPILENSPLNFGPNIFSFPSGYATRSTLIFMFFVVLKPLPVILWIPLYAWWFCIIISRILLRKHHILDVLGGIVIGFMESVLISVCWFEKDTAISIFNWISDEKTVGADGEVL